MADVKSDDGGAPDVRLESGGQNEKAEGCPVEDLPDHVKNQFTIEVVKSGRIVNRAKVAKTRLTFGRSRDCDFPLDHPSISRVHATLLWKTSESRYGTFYLVDSSTHGTTLNKKRITAGVPVVLEPGNNVFSFGGSTRLFTLNPPSGADEDDDDFDDEEEEMEEKGGFCSWGISDEAELVDESETEPLKRLETVMMLLRSSTDSFSSPNDHAYKENPQKTLQQWFDREGYEYEYKMDCQNGRFKCVFELPIEGQDIVVDGATQYKKKDAIFQASLKACYLLDKAELLFPWQQQRTAGHKRANESSSEDDVYDETEQAKQKKARKLQQKKPSEVVDTFDSLTEKLVEVTKEIEAVKLSLQKMPSGTKSASNPVQSSADSLDAFMENLSKADIDGRAFGLSMKVKVEKSKLRMTLNQLEKEKRRLHKLVKIANPGWKMPELRLVKKEEPLPEMSIDPATTDSKLEEPKEPPTESCRLPKVEDVAHSQADVEPAEISEMHSENNSGEIVERKKEKPAKTSSMQGVGATVNKERKLNREKGEKYFDREAYIEWQPPASQSGDGRTSLNDKYGY